MIRFSSTRPYHGPTQIFLEEFLELPHGTKIRMHHFVVGDIVAILLGFEDKTYIVQWETEYGTQTWEHHYTDSGLVEYDTNKWSPNNWVSVDALPVIEVVIVKHPTEFYIRWQEVGF